MKNLLIILAYIITAIFVCVIVYVFVATGEKNLEKEKIRITYKLLKMTSRAVDNYITDNGDIPCDNYALSKKLVTPKNYIRDQEGKYDFITYGLPPDPFSGSGDGEITMYKLRYGSKFIYSKETLHIYKSVSENSMRKYLLTSIGPDGKRDIMNDNISRAELINNVYDATNGTISNGDIIN